MLRREALRSSKAVDWAGIADVVAKRFGLHFPPARSAELERAITAACAELGLSLSASVIAESEGLPGRNAVLAKYLTVGETYFFRDRGLFDTLESAWLPRFVAAHAKTRREVRMWSAGCATGEEPYSLAMCWERAAVTGEGWRPSILGSDVNASAIAAAKTGVYREWSFRGDTADLKQRFFQQRDDGAFEIAPLLRARVDFEICNLVDHDWPERIVAGPGFDLILCRNVLMYFVPERAKEVVARLTDCLAPEGLIVFGSCELSDRHLGELVSFRLGDTTFYARADEIPWLGATSWPKSRKRLDEGDSAAAVPVDAVRDSSEVRRSVTADRSQPERRAPREPLARTAPALTAPVVTPAAAESKGAAAISAFAGAQEAADAGRLEEALQQCDRALEWNRLDAPGHYLRASVLSELGRVGDAERALQTVLYIDRRFVLAHIALGRLALRAQQPADARRHLLNAEAILEAQSGAVELPGASGFTGERLLAVVRMLLATMGAEQ